MRTSALSTPALATPNVRRLLRRFIVAGLLGCTAASPLVANASGDPRQKAQAAILDIWGVCKDKGMLACEPRIDGLGPVFESIRLNAQFGQDDERIQRFVNEKFGPAEGFHFEAISASLHFRQTVNLNFTPESIDKMMRVVTPVASGFDITTEDGSKLVVRQANGVWRMGFPPSMGQAFEAKFAPFHALLRLRHKILTYRMMEADMAGLDRAAFQAGINGDLFPIVVAVAPKEKVPAIAKWLSKDPKEVIAFYDQFGSEAAMRSHIASEHHLLH